MSDFQERMTAINKEWGQGNAIALYGLVRALRPTVVVEIGSYLGYSAAWMAQALKENNHGTLFCIDNFSLDVRAKLEDALATADVRERVTIIEGDSDKVKWPTQVDFAYVDGWHSYPIAKHDFWQCQARGAEYICIDDTTSAVGPRMLVQELRQFGEWEVLDIRRCTGMSVCVRKTPLGPITFSQELPGNPGVDLQLLSSAAQEAHFEEAQRVNNVDYRSILPEVVEVNSIRRKL